MINRGSNKRVSSSEGGAGRGSQFYSSRPSLSSEASSSRSDVSGSSRFRSKPPTSGGRSSKYQSQPSELYFGNREAIEKVDIKTIKIEDIPSNGSSNTSMGSSSTTQGVTSRAVVNYIPLKAPEGPFYLYDVKIHPQVDLKRLACFLVTQVMPKDEIFLFNGISTLYTTKPLTKNKETFEKTFKKDNTVYKITINFARSLSSQLMDATILQFININLKEAQQTHLPLKRIGRNHYNTNEKVIAKSEQHNIMVIPGTNWKTFLAQNGLMLNVDMIYKTLRTDTVYSMLQDLTNKFKSNRERIVNEFKNTIVMCSYNQRTVHIDGIEFSMSPKSTFTKKNGEKTTIAKYYEEQYNIKIKDMNQPLLVHIDRKDPSRREYFLPELSILTGKTNEMRKNHQLMKSLKSATNLTPNQRIRQIALSLQEHQQNKDYTNQLEQWGLEIGDKFVQVETRILPTEKIIFGDNKTVNAVDGVWEVKRNKFFKPVDIQNWIVFYPTGSKAETTNFIKVTIEVAKELGMKLSVPKFIEIEDYEAESYGKVIENHLEIEKPNFVMVVLYNDQKQRYSRVKMVCKRLGVVSQCVKLSTISSEKQLPTKITNTNVQICAKLGGIPWKIPLNFPQNEPTIIIGMDVYHSGEIYRRKNSSVIGFVCIGPNNLFFSDSIEQEPGKEIVDVLEQFMTKALEFFKNQDVIPKHAIFLRDGVGEGQKEAVLEREVSACKKAIANKAPGCKLNYVIVSKRINTRIFAQTDPQNPTNFSNPVAGTVLDYGVTNQRSDPNVIEYYMVSHNVPNVQGTATPTKYHTICNESSLTKEYMEELSFKLCHNNYIGFGTTKVPSLCLYAHKIADQVGQYTKSTRCNEKLQDKPYFL